MKHLAPIVLLIFSLYISCISNNKPPVPANTPGFIIKEYPASFDTTIGSIAWYKGYYLCGQDNGKIAILDSNYRRCDSLEKRINQLQMDEIFTCHDTVFAYLYKKNKAYILNSDFGLKEYKGKFKTMSPIYEDSIWYVYACCLGEWGGAVFFLNKEDNKTYSYPATCASQVLRFKNQYIMCSNLAHLSYNTNFLRIRQPAGLYELTNNKQKSFCNWYTEIDSLRDYTKHRNDHGTTYYRGPRDAMTLLSFSKDDSLYSIICKDSTTMLMVHNNDSLVAEQTILSHRIPFHEAKVIQAGKRTVCLYIFGGLSPFEAHWETGNNSGLVIVNGNRIDMVYKKQVSK